MMLKSLERAIRNDVRLIISLWMSVYMLYYNNYASRHSRTMDAVKLLVYVSVPAVTA